MPKVAFPFAKINAYKAKFFVQKYHNKKKMWYLCTGIKNTIWKKSRIHTSPLQA